MRVSKTGKGASPKKAKVSNDLKNPVKILDQEREFFAKTLGELLAWLWWKTITDVRHSEKKDLLADQ